MIIVAIIDITSCQSSCPTKSTEDTVMVPSTPKK